jgi:transketolase
MTIQEMEVKAQKLREVVLSMTYSAQAGRIASSYSCTEILTALYYGNILKFNAKDPNWENRDRFIMSKGHASPVLYAILGDLGFFDYKEIETYSQPGSLLGTLLDDKVPGAEILGGSLGCGFGIAAGMACALKNDRSRSLVFTLLGDAECCEGSIWETAMFVGFRKLNNLITIIDRNNVSASAFVQEDFSNEPFADKWKAFGFNVVNINGHSLVEIMDALKDIRTRKTSSPLLIIADTIKGKGVQLIENEPFWHSKVVTQNIYEQVCSQLNQKNNL